MSLLTYALCTMYCCLLYRIPQGVEWMRTILVVVVQKRQTSLIQHTWRRGEHCATERAHTMPPKCPPPRQTLPSPPPLPASPVATLGAILEARRGEGEAPACPPVEEKTIPARSCTLLTLVTSALPLPWCPPPFACLADLDDMVVLLF